MGTLPQWLNRRQVILAVLLLTLGWSGTAQAQVGMQSGLAQVSLLATSLPQASLHTTGGALGLSANSAYSLVVRMVPQVKHASRIWVRSADGHYQELTAGSPVIIARSTRGGVKLDQPMDVRLEPGAADRPLPLVYELRLDPAL